MTRKRNTGGFTSILLFLSKTEKLDWLILVKLDILKKPFSRMIGLWPLKKESEARINGRK